MLNLLRNPSKLERLLQELETRKARGLLSDPVTFEEAEACPYLQAVFWEGVRLYPAIGSPLARVVPKGGMTIDGKFVPAGVRSPPLPPFFFFFKCTTKRRVRLQLTRM